MGLYQNVSNWLLGSFRVRAIQQADGSWVQVVTNTSTPTGSALTPLAPATATAGLASGNILAANANRRGLVISNTSANRIFLAFGSNNAVLNKGIYLSPGGVWEMESSTFTTQAVNAIASGAGSTVSIQEYQ